MQGKCKGRFRRSRKPMPVSGFNPENSGSGIGPRTTPSRFNSRAEGWLSQREPGIRKRRRGLRRVFIRIFSHSESRERLPSTGHKRQRARVSPPSASISERCKASRACDQLPSTPTVGIFAGSRATFSRRGRRARRRSRPSGRRGRRLRHNRSPSSHRKQSRHGGLRLWQGPEVTRGRQGRREFLPTPSFGRRGVCLRRKS